jgi:hypothetical protein
VSNADLESILVVFQNPAEGHLYAYDDWYTNVHIRDAMRLDGAIATQRFIVHDDQLVLGGRKVTPGHWAHTIYEWESAAKSVQGHHELGATPLMEITRNCSFINLRDYFYRPNFLSHGWNRETGFRTGDTVLTAMIKPKAGTERSFAEWFQNAHAPATLSLPGFATCGLFTLHEEQSLPNPCPFPLVAIYGLTDARTALPAWSARYDAKGECDLSAQVEDLEATCWHKRINRLRAEEVRTPKAQAEAEEQRAREAYRDTYMSREELAHILTAH